MAKQRETQASKSDRPSFESQRCQLRLCGHGQPHLSPALLLLQFRPLAPLAWILLWPLTGVLIFPHSLPLPSSLFSMPQMEDWKTFQTHCATSQWLPFALMVKHNLQWPYKALRGLLSACLSSPFRTVLALGLQLIPTLAFPWYLECITYFLHSAFAPDIPSFWHTHLCALSF